MKRYIATAVVAIGVLTPAPAFAATAKATSAKPVAKKMVVVSKAAKKAAPTTTSKTATVAKTKHAPANVWDNAKAVTSGGRRFC